MNIFKRNTKSVATPAVASVAEDEHRNEHQHDDTIAQIAALEAEIENDPAAKAALELETFALTPGAKHLLDLALDNMSTNTGEGIDDPQQRASIRLRAELIDAAGGDLSVVIEALVASCEKPTEVAPSLYSLLYNVVKSAGFYANLDYRRYLDPRADFDLSPYAPQGDEAWKAANGVDSAMHGNGSPDKREDDPSAPDGLDTVVDRELALYRSLYGAEVIEDGDVILCAWSDLRMFCQLTVESYGWEGDDMPFTFAQETDGSFTPISDVRTAIDAIEINRQKSRARRAEREAVRVSAAIERARKLTAKALGK